MSGRRRTRRTHSRVQSLESLESPESPETRAMMTSVPSYASYSRTRPGSRRVLVVTGFSIDVQGLTPSRSVTGTGAMELHQCIMITARREEGGFDAAFVLLNPYKIPNRGRMVLALPINTPYMNLNKGRHEETLNMNPPSKCKK